MSLKPISPSTQKKRSVRPAPMPVVIVNKKKSGSSGLVITGLLLVALGGGYYAYSSQQQKNEEALAAKQARLEENAKNMAENERLREEHKQAKAAAREAARKGPKETLMGTVGAPSPDSVTTSGTTSSLADVDSGTEADDAAPAKTTALGSTAAPTAGTGVYAEEDTSAPVFDLNATGNAAKKVTKKLDEAIEAASKGDTFHDLQADLKRAFEVAKPGLFADASTLPPFPDKGERLLRLAQGVYVCLNLAAELAAEDKVPAEKHAKFVNWLMKDKAKAARTFTYGLEHCGINDTAAATALLEELRKDYLRSGSSTAMENIPKILKAAAKE